MQSTRIVAHGVLPLRAQPTNDAEQVSQQWRGCRVRVLREEGGWAYVESDDTYRGWADARFLARETEQPMVTVTSAFAEVREGATADSALITRLPILSRVCEGFGSIPASALVPLPTIPPSEIAANAARRGRDFLGTPYLWGGSTPFGLDCSGFVQLAYRLGGLTLRRDASIQRTDPRFVAVPLDDPRSGDLIFFGAGPEKITHVGMACADGTFIHAAGGTAGVIVTPVGDDRYWPRRIDARRLDPARVNEPVTRPTPEMPESL